MATKREKVTSPVPRKQLVTDDKGGVYELGKRIAEGGQGIVCPTQDSRYLVKVSKYAVGDPRSHAWCKQIAAVQRMPIQENALPIAMPVAIVTKPRAGYVMELMDGLVPLEAILKETHEALVNGESLVGFLSTGGLSRRLRLLARFARVMAKLHGLGIAHGDLSPKNVFVSQSVGHDQVWLIDCDNLTYAVRDSSLQIYTPDYGAPEVFRGDHGISTYTDVWSFAVIAFQLLTLLHPFKSGQLVDSDSDLEENAFRGELPWVDHDSDDRNRASEGIPREAVLTEQLSALFQRCFNEGLLQPERRPPMAEWAESLEAAAAFQVSCDASEGGCGSTFLWSDDLECPFCGEKQTKSEFAVVDHMVFAPLSYLGEDASPAERWIRTGYRQIVGKTPVHFRESAPGTATYLDSKELASLWIEDGELYIKVERGSDLKLQTAGVKKLEPLRGRVKLPIRDLRLAIHVGTFTTPHNVWRLTW
jgi:DNA-binding helix-hairpin-helix protein with protein kinase domain